MQPSRRRLRTPQSRGLGARAHLRPSALLRAAAARRSGARALFPADARAATARNGPGYSSCAAVAVAPGSAPVPRDDTVVRTDEARAERYYHNLYCTPSSRIPEKAVRPGTTVQYSACSTVQHKLARPRAPRSVYDTSPNDTVLYHIEGALLIPFSMQ